MSEFADINELVSFAFRDSIYISKDRREEIESKFDAQLIQHLNAILKDSTWPSEPWTTASSLSDAANTVEQKIRQKYPELSDASLAMIMNYACFSWK